MASTHHTLRTLADVTGVTHSTISRVLNGKVLPDLGTLARLEVAFGFPLWPGLASLPPPELSRPDSALKAWRCAPGPCATLCLRDTRERRRANDSLTRSHFHLICLHWDKRTGFQSSNAMNPPYSFTRR